MSAKHFTQQDLTSRALATGVPHRITMSIVEVFLKWSKCSGEEWTVGRFKDAKLDVIRKRAGLPPVSVWIAKGRKMIFSGPLGLLEAWMFKHPDNFKKGIQLLQIYTSYISARVTPKQKNKFVSAVTAPPPTCEVLHKVEQSLSKGLKLSGLKGRQRHYRFKRILDRFHSSSRRAPLWDNSTVEERNGILDSVLYLTRTRGSFLHYLKYRHWYDQVLGEIRPFVHRFLETDLSQSILAKEWEGTVPCDLVVGRIGLIQEPGYKLRAVANPGRIFQSVLEPLQKALLHIVDSLPWDCTHDQTWGIPKIQKALSQGRMVHSIDLSNATDYFPIELQTFVLRKLFPDKCEFQTGMVDLFDEISRSWWMMPGYDGNYIRWTRGQPLGLNPSFPSFALTHGLLLLGLLGREYSDEFFVLGDDVVILDSDLRDRYIQCLHDLGCPTSEAKSLSSTCMAEFAGKLITKDDVIPQYKYRIVSDDSFLDIARIVGPKGLRLFKPRQRRVIEHVSEVPEFLGGLGWNPKGKTLSDRVQDWCFADYQPIPRLTSLSEERIHRMMSSTLIQSVIEMDRKVCLPVSYPMPSDDLDQRSLDLFTKYIPSLKLWYAISGKNLDMVLHLEGIRVDLPVRVADGESASSCRKATTLTKWERMIGTLE
jgi:hypothetical protein